MIECDCCVVSEFLLRVNNDIKIILFVHCLSILKSVAFLALNLAIKNLTDISVLCLQRQQWKQVMSMSESVLRATCRWLLCLRMFRQAARLHPVETWQRVPSAWRSHVSTYKSKVLPVHVMKVYWVEVLFHSFLTWALGGGEWSASRYGR
jgi:hypothetical protein